MNRNAFVFGRMMWLPPGAGIDLPQILDATSGSRRQVAGRALSVRCDGSRNGADAESDGSALGLECLQICHDIRELIRIEPELRHRRMVGNNAFGQAPAQALDREFEMQCAERGATVRGLSLTLSIAWHCAQ